MITKVLKTPHSKKRAPCLLLVGDDFEIKP